jgi:hypothetical protein
VVRLRIFIAINVICAFAIFPLLYFFVGIVAAAAFLGAWPVSAIAIYDRIINVPIIGFKENGILKNSFPITDRKGNIWNFLRVTIVNSGLAAAKECTAELRVLKWPRSGGQVCPVPTNETKALKWAGSKPGEKRGIPSRRGEAILDVFVDDTSIAQNIRSVWYAANTWGPIAIWAATPDVYQYTPQTRGQDAFCQGTYDVEITIYPENGNPQSKKYELKVDADWSNTLLRPVS